MESCPKVLALIALAQCNGFGYLPALTVAFYQLVGSNLTPLTCIELSG